MSWSTTQAQQKWTEGVSVYIPIWQEVPGVSWPFLGKTYGYMCAFGWGLGHFTLPHAACKVFDRPNGHTTGGWYGSSRARFRWHVTWHSPIWWYFMLKTTWMKQIRVCITVLLTPGLRVHTTSHEDTLWRKCYKIQLSTLPWGRRGGGGILRDHWWRSRGQGVTGILVEWYSAKPAWWIIPSFLGLTGAQKHIIIYSHHLSPESSRMYIQKKESINLGILDFEVGKCKIGVYQSEGKEPCHVNLCGLSKSKLNPLFGRGLRRQRARMEKQKRRKQEEQKYQWRQVSGSPVQSFLLLSST